MKPIKIYATIFLILGLALLANINAQEKSSLKHSTFKFAFKKAAKGDTVNSLFCVMTVSDLSNFEKVCLSYNGKTKKYTTKSLFKEKSEEYNVEGNYIFFIIREELGEPFVIIEGENKDGRKYDIYEYNAKGRVINPREEKERWKKSTARIDSMDYVRQFDGVYTGKDGKPRFKNKSGKVYIIEKDHIKPE